MSIGEALHKPLSILRVGQHDPGQSLSRLGAILLQLVKMVNQTIDCFLWDSSLFHGLLSFLHRTAVGRAIRVEILMAGSGSNTFRERAGIHIGRGIG
jgi:hypothetical protein